MVWDGRWRCWCGRLVSRKQIHVYVQSIKDSQISKLEYHCKKCGTVDIRNVESNDWAWEDVFGWVNDG